MNDTTYNGWTNYETWVVKLWIDNDEGEQEYWIDETRRLKSDEYDLAEALQRHYSENTPTVTGVYADLLNQALGSVDWREIATSLIELVSEIDECDEAEAGGAS